MAYFLHLQGRGEDARAAQAAAQDLAGGEARIVTGEMPFLLELARLAVTLAQKMLQETREALPGASGLIAPPTQPLILRR